MSSEQCYEVDTGQQRLRGIWHQAPRGRAAAPAVLMLSAGLLHHTGPNRLHVELARALGAAGHSSLRFDLSGLGDSDQRRGNSAASGEILAVIDDLQARFGIDRFALFGLCTGADDAIRSLPRDPRLVAACLVDWVAYPTLRHHWHRFWGFVFPRVIDPARLRRHLARLPARLRASHPAAADAGPAPELDTDEFFTAPPRADAERRIAAMLDAGKALQFVYTGALHASFSYRAQFLAMFPSLRRRRGHALVHLPAADHTFYLRRHRAALIEQVTAWLQQPHSPPLGATRGERASAEPTLAAGAGQRSIAAAR